MLSTSRLHSTRNWTSINWCPRGETLESLILTATEQRDELAMLEAEANSLRENSTAVRARSRPQFALTGGYMYLENAFLDCG